MKIPQPGIFPLTNEITKVVLANARMYVEIINLGAAIYGIYLPAKETGFDNIVLNYANVQDYATDNYYIGATVGRIAGRVGRGLLQIGEKTYQLAKNDNGTHHLHGGHSAFNKKIFEVLLQEDHPDRSIAQLRCLSTDGEEGYPGNMELTVTYTLYHDDTLTITYEAVSDKPTIANFTNHTYFNLSGPSGSALGQHLQIGACTVLDTDTDFIPTGKMDIPVEGTPFDFNKPVAIKHQKEQLSGLFFNQFFNLSRAGDSDAVLSDPASGRKMAMRSTYPGILFYSGDYLAYPFKPCQGVCLEAQFCPRTPNGHIHEPKVLYPGNTYSQHISWKFFWPGSIC